MTEHGCQHCLAPAADAYLCHDCIDRMRRWLIELMGYAVDLADVVLTRQTSRRGERVMVRGDTETPLAFDPDASEVAWVLHSDLVAITRDLCDVTGTTYPGVDSSAALAAWLAGRKRVTALAARPDALETYQLLRHLAANGSGHDQQPTGYVVKAVDISPARVLLGPCDHPVDGGRCGADVRARDEDTTTHCLPCGTVHDVAAFRRRVLDRMGDQLATATEIADHLRGVVKAGTIGRWKGRGKIVAHGQTPAGADLYRVGDVLSVLGERSVGVAVAE